MYLLANLSPALTALKPLAELATKHSFVPTTSPLHSASSVTLTSLILRFNTSASLNSFFRANSLNINKMFSSLKNKPCFLQHKPPSRTISLSRTLTLRLMIYLNKSNNLRLSSLICCKPKGNCNARDPQRPTHLLGSNSFTAVLIPTATGSSLLPGNALHATNTRVLNAGNPRITAMMPTTFAIRILSLLLRFSKHPRSHAPVARFLCTKPKGAIKCSARNANAFGLGTPANLKLAVTTRTTCSGCAKIIPTACLATPMTYNAVAKLIITSFLRSIVLSRPPSLHYLPIMTLTFSATSSLPFHPSLICAITICINSKLLTAFTSIYPLARLSFQILSRLQNSNNSRDAIIYSSSKTKTLCKFY